ncbi:MAG TPA: MFS transporter [Bacteroidales bacterium]|nr:MFS transporter [Bacteroidales bacterium]HPS63242.1 MFS transporter [Bacteroidales bacterium]
MRNRHDAYAALKIRDYRLFLSFRFFTTIAFQMQGLIVGWQMYELTHDPLALGLIGLAEALPNIATALFAGHAADRYDRKRIITGFTLLFLAGTALLFMFSVRSMGILDRYGVFPIYLVVMISGISRAFLYPAIIALMSQLVPRELYNNASTWNSTGWHVAAITGPALGGVIYGFFGVRVAYLSVLFFLFVSMLLLSLVKRRPLPAMPDDEPLGKRLSSGLKFVFQNQVLLGAMSLDMFAVLFGGAIAMLPVFAAEVLKVGPQGLGLLRASPMAGAVIMSLILAHRPPTVHAGRWLMIGVTGFGLSIIGFALSKNFYLSAALLMMSGMFDNVSVIIRATAMQLITPDEMRGRVASVNAIFIGSSNEIGSFESGLAARLMGLIPSVIFGGMMTLGIVGFTSRFAPKLRKLNLEEIG